MLARVFLDLVLAYLREPPRVESGEIERFRSLTSTLVCPIGAADGLDCNSEDLRAAYGVSDVTILHRNQQETLILEQ